MADFLIPSSRSQSQKWGLAKSTGRDKVQGHLRTDIQVLRGLAILLVILFHSKLLAPLKAGYLGVDIFFVVSGFLVTGIVQRGLQAGNFSFTEFYIRRAKRLLPASYVTLLVTSLATPWVLTAPEMKDFTRQLFGAVTFTGNIALWMQTGYFERAAYLKPLLHIWSLSIEEQYYLLLPAALVVTPRRYWKIGALVMVIGSLVLCLMLVPIKPGAAFYLLPTRAWELGLGSLGALVLTESAAGALLGKLFWPALVALCVLPFYPTGEPHPGLDALIVCTAALIIILRRHPLLNHGQLMRPLAWLGDISYSLYLVHWPLLAFAANAWVSPVPGEVPPSLMGLAVVLAWALYRFVEQPMRRVAIPVNRSSLGAMFGFTVMLVGLGFAILAAQTSVSAPDYVHLGRGNVGLSLACEYSGTFAPNRECRTSDTPQIMVWGDSYAMHWVEGIQATTSRGVVQATRSNCGPLLGISMFSPSGLYNRAWGEKCIKFNDDIMTYLALTPSVEVVVLASSYSQYLAGHRLLTRGHLSPTVEAAGIQEIDGNEDVAFLAQNQTVAAIRSLGKRVVVIAPPPSASGVDFGRCLERKATGKIVMGADTPSCAILETRFHSDSRPVRSLLERVAQAADVNVFYLDATLCNAGTCAVAMDDTFLYRDSGHLSYDGSRLLGQKLDLSTRLTALAR